MKILKFLEDLNIISSLGDNPSTDNGLTSEGLKAKFDEGVLKLQRYINTEIVEKINVLLGTDAPIFNGANMAGSINMNNNSLFGLSDPTTSDSASNKGYVDDSIVVSPIQPTRRNVLWFDTSLGAGTTEQAAMLALDDNEAGYAVQASVGGEDYGVANATVNNVAAGAAYDFTVL